MNALDRIEYALLNDVFIRLETKSRRILPLT